MHSIVSSTERNMMLDSKREVARQRAGGWLFLMVVVALFVAGQPLTKAGIGAVIEALDQHDRRSLQQNLAEARAGDADGVQAFDQVVAGVDNQAARAQQALDFYCKYGHGVVKFDPVSKSWVYLTPDTKLTLHARLAWSRASGQSEELFNSALLARCY